MRPHDAKSSREYRSALTKLTTAVTFAIARLDEEMRRPSDMDRGKRVVAIVNALDLANNQAMHFALGYPFPKIRRTKDAAAAREEKP